MTLFFSIMWDCYIEFEAVCTFTMHYSVFTEVFWYSFTCREAQNIITETWYVAKYSSKRGIDLELPRQLKRRWQMRRVILFRRDSEHVQLIYSFQREAQLSSRSMHWGNKWKKGRLTYVWSLHRITPALEWSIIFTTAINHPFNAEFR